MNENATRQFVLLVIINSFVGGMVGLERTVLPLIAESDFGVASKAATLAFIATFGATKALLNLAAGRMSERWGRRRVLLLGWLLGIPVPFMIMIAPSWPWILSANVLLGANQALTWSMTLVMKVDLVSPSRRGLAVGMNEFAGYSGLALAALGSGVIASEFGLRPEPFYAGVLLAVCGFSFSLAAHETRPMGRTPGAMQFRRILQRVSWTNPVLSSASAGGLVVNLKDGVLWGLLPVLLRSRGVPMESIAAVVALYPAMWGITQIFFGPLSDRVGRKKLIAAGLGLQGLGVVGFALGDAYVVYIGSAVLTGVGTAMAYPVLLALVSDASEEEWRASALGIYRFWRDFGYVCGALGMGTIADAYGLADAFLSTGIVLILVMVLVLTRVREEKTPQ